jgi:D-glycero-beta-D-manno-heptose 1-phosphate adenylyltransferase
LRPSGEKIVRDARALSQRLEALSRPRVFTNGCFDILHRGHVDYLEKAAALGSALVVGVNSDASVRRLKQGPLRPIMPLDDRMALLAALECVSLVTAFEEDTPLQLIKIVRPDHLVKGGDWETSRIVGSDIVNAYGGKIHSIPFHYDRSTSAIIKRIRG